MSHAQFDQVGWAIATIYVEKRWKTIARKCKGKVHDFLDHFLVMIAGPIIMPLTRLWSQNFADFPFVPLSPV